MAYYYKSPKIIRFIVAFSGGLVKNERQAGYILWGVIAAMIVAALMMAFNAEPDVKSSVPEPEFNFLET